MKNGINNPELVRINGVIVNKLVKLKNDKFLVDAVNLSGDSVEGLIVGEKLADVVATYIGKICDVVYKDCIAGVTEYIDDEDPTETVQTHTVDHKQVVDILKLNDMSLLMTCIRNGLRDEYELLKEMNK